MCTYMYLLYASREVLILRINFVFVIVINFATLMIILLLYVEAHIFILETLTKLGIYYRMMLVLLLFMHLLIVD